MRMDDILTSHNVIELLILETVYRHTKDKNVIKSSQHGFTKGKSCLTSLINFCGKMTVPMGERRALDIVYLKAFRKAFNAISYSTVVREACELQAG